MSKEEIQSLITTNEVEKMMLSIRGKNVLLDRDVAALYGVETRIVNQAVKNLKEIKGEILLWVKTRMNLLFPKMMRK